MEFNVVLTPNLMYKKFLFMLFKGTIPKNIVHPCCYFLNKSWTIVKNLSPQNGRQSCLKQQYNSTVLYFLFWGVRLLEPDPWKFQLKYGNFRFSFFSHLFPPPTAHPSSFPSLPTNTDATQSHIGVGKIGQLTCSGTQLRYFWSASATSYTRIDKPLSSLENGNATNAGKTRAMKYIACRRPTNCC